jgi:SAM-dependent methyltransferase
MTLDQAKIKEFWDAQAKKSKKLRIEGIANLEEDPTLLEEKVKLEYDKIINKIDLSSINSRVLDLGAGVGQWSFIFSKIAKKVDAVEYSIDMLDLAIKEGSRRNITNVNYINSPAQEFQSSNKYDLIWISGLLIYLSDDDCERLVSNCYSMLRNAGTLLLRDGTGVKQRHEIDNSYSKDLDSYYSATYRTSEEYMALFNSIGFKLVEDEDMFEDGSRLNKWKETRLRVYKFEK